MIRRYRVFPSLMKCKGIFEVVLEGVPCSGCTLPHMRELIFKHEQSEVPASELSSFTERFLEIEVLGNSIADLGTADFRQWAMGDAVCDRFWREEYVLQTTDHLADTQYIGDESEWQQQLEWWREQEEQQFLALAGVPLTTTGKNRSRRSKRAAEVA
jgi:hypothetical protein